MPAVDLVSLPPTEAIPELLDRYGGKIYRLGLKMCGNEDDAADLLQEIFLTALRKWDQFEGRSEPSTWLYTIAVRACQRGRRRRAGEPAHIASLEELLPSHEGQVATVPPDDDPLTEMMRREAADRVATAISLLPPPYRLPLVLKEIGELPVSDVADVLGLKEATVKTRLHRARLQLRKALEGALPTVEAPAPDHARQVCLDLLQGKQEALDRGVDYRVPPSELCIRCQSLFATLDLAQDLCQHMGRTELPPPVKALLLERLADS